MSSISTANSVIAQMLRAKAFRLQVDSVDMPTFFGPNHTPDISVPSSFLENVSKPTGPGLLTELERVFFEHVGGVWLEDVEVSDFSAAMLELFNYHEPKDTIEKGKTVTFSMNGAQQVDIEVAAVVKKATSEYTCLVLNASGKVRLSTHPLGAAPHLHLYTCT